MPVLKVPIQTLLQVLYSQVKNPSIDFFKMSYSVNPFDQPDTAQDFLMNPLYQSVQGSAEYDNFNMINLPPYQYPDPGLQNLGPPSGQFSPHLGQPVPNYQQEFANALNQDFFQTVYRPDLGQQGYGPSRGIYQGGSVMMMEPAPSSNQYSFDNNYAQPDPNVISPVPHETSGSSGHSPEHLLQGSDQPQDFLQYQWEGFDNPAAAGQLIQPEPPTLPGYFINKIEYLDDSQDQIIIELDQNMPGPGDPVIQESSAAPGSVSELVPNSFPRSSPGSTSPPIVEVHHDDHEDVLDVHVSYPAGSTDQTKVLASTVFMKSFKQQLDTFLATHGPIIIPPATSFYPKVAGEHKPGKISQPQRRQIKKDENAGPGLPDIIPMDLTKLDQTGLFSFGCQAWTLSFDNNPKFKQFFFAGK